VPRAGPIRAREVLAVEVVGEALLTRQRIGTGGDPVQVLFVQVVVLAAGVGQRQQIAVRVVGERRGPTQGVDEARHQVERVARRSGSRPTPTGGCSSRPNTAQGWTRRAVEAALAGDRDGLVVALARERDRQQRVDRARLQAYAAAAQPYLEAMTRIPAQERPLSAGHERVNALAERLLPFTVDLPEEPDGAAQ
jgi:hypothetical protein